MLDRRFYNHLVGSSEPSQFMSDSKRRLNAIATRRADGAVKCSLTKDLHTS